MTGDEETGHANTQRCSKRMQLGVQGSKPALIQAVLTLLDLLCAGRTSSLLFPVGKPRGDKCFSPKTNSPQHSLCQLELQTVRFSRTRVDAVWRNTPITQACTHMHRHIHMYAHGCMHAHTASTYMHVHIYTCTHVCIPTSTCTHRK